MREAYDPSAPASVPGHVQFQPKPKSLSGNVMLDPGSLSANAKDALAAQARARGHASNELMVSGSRSATHHPIMVAGPQIGYYYPGLTTEVVENAPGHPPARRDQRSLPGLHLHRAKPGPGLVVDLGRA